MKILIIEDEYSLADAIAETLKKEKISTPIIILMAKSEMSDKLNGLENGADEPTGNLDKDTENDILNIFEKLAKRENKCIIIVTHSQNVCDRANEVYEFKKMLVSEAYWAY